eukprot:gene13771-13892_t
MAHTLAYTYKIVFVSLLLYSTLCLGTPSTIEEYLKANNNTKVLSLLKHLGVNISTPRKIQGTLLVPSDKAVEAWLKQSGLAEKDVLANKRLVDLVLAYHFMPGHSISNLSSVPVNSTGTKGITADINYGWRVYRDAKTNRVWVQDVQGNNVTLAKPTVVNKLSIIPVDTVLMSGAYFKSLQDALNFYPQWKAANDFFKKQGTGVKLGDGSTVFVPDNAAFKKNEQAVASLSSAAAADVLRNHVVKSNLIYPTNASEVNTILPGQKLNFKYTPREYIAPFTRKDKLTINQVQVTSGSGAKANVTMFNVFAGKDVVQGVDNILIPAAPAAKSGSAAAAVGAKQGRRLMQANWVGTNMPSYNAAAQSYYQGYPNMFRDENIKSAMTAAEDGDDGNWGAGYDSFT